MILSAVPEVLEGFEPGRPQDGFKPASRIAFITIGFPRDGALPLACSVVSLAAFVIALSGGARLRASLLLDDRAAGGSGSSLEHGTAGSGCGCELSALRFSSPTSVVFNSLWVAEGQQAEPAWHHQRHALFLTLARYRLKSVVWAQSWDGRGASLEEAGLRRQRRLLLQLRYVAAVCGTLRSWWTWLVVKPWRQLLHL